MTTPIEKQQTSPLKPLILLADSQLLFLKDEGSPYIRRLLKLFTPGQLIKAAYIGASNGDQHEFYQMFEMAMNSIGITDCLHVDNKLTHQQLDFLSTAQIILLAGGDTWLGWQTIRQMAPQINQARKQGAILIGTSAGSVQMGTLGHRDKSHLCNTDLFSTFGFVRAMFSPHEEKQDWKMLKQMVQQTAGTMPAIGIPSGSGLIITNDNLVQSVRKPAVTFTIKDNKLVEQSAWKIQL